MLLLGCDSGQHPAVKAMPSPPVDVSTPDRALKSYWAQVDWLTASDHALKAHNRSGDTFTTGMSALAKVANQGRVASANYQQPLYTYSREITEAKVETDSRAVVFATIRNTTPLPANANLDAADKKRREEGSRYKYVLEKSQNAWQVAEVWPWADWNKDYQKEYPMGDAPLPIYVQYGG
jgi:hypothetical protein